MNAPKYSFVIYIILFKVNFKITEKLNSKWSNKTEFIWTKIEYTRAIKHDRLIENIYIVEVGKMNIIHTQIINKKQ